ncbi:MAG: hypothetical protein JNM93_01735 [Bacteriovoracaceae bacterium]|nr:hypothetical protein [Bacteriovoracaceae bacterium]
MKWLFLLFTFHLTSLAFSDTSLEKQCVEQLCGKFNDSPVYFLNEYKFMTYLSMPQVQRWSMLKNTIVDLTKKRKVEIEKYSQAVNAANFDFKSWSDKDIVDRLPGIFETRFAIYTDTHFPIGKRLLLLPLTRSNEPASFKKLIEKLIQFRMAEYNVILKYSAVMFKGFKNQLELKTHLIKSLDELKTLVSEEDKVSLTQMLSQLSASNKKNNELESAINLHDALMYKYNPQFDTKDIRKFCDKTCVTGLRNYFTDVNFKLQFENLKNYYGSERMEKIEVANCIQEFLQKSSGTINMRKYFYPKISSLEERVTDFMHERGYSKTAIDRFQKHLESTVYKLNSEQPERAGDKTGLMKDIIEYEYRNLGKIDYSQLSDDALLDKIFSDLDGRNPIHNYRTFCKADKKIDKADQVHSKSMTGNGTIELYLSDLTALFPEYGVQIFLHEFGHVVSNIFAEKNMPPHDYKKYKSFRQCVSSDYVKPMKLEDGDFRRHAGDYFLTEEDSSDVFSYLLTKTDKQLVECTLLSPNVFYDDYHDFDFRYIKDGRLDNHSATFLRILREARYKGKTFGTACQQVVKKYSDTIKFKTCFF